MFCLCSRFHGHRDRYISGEIKPIFPCHNCTLSCIHYMKLFIKKSPHLARFPCICSNKGSMAGLFMPRMLLSPVTLEHWQCLRFLLTGTKEKLVQLSSERRCVRGDRNVRGFLPRGLFLWESLYSQATMPAFRRSKTRAKSLALARKTQQQAAAAYGSLHRMFSVVSSAAAWVKLGGCCLIRLR